MIKNYERVVGVQEKLYIFNQMVESSIAGLIASDLEGNLEYENPFCFRMWGYQKAGEMLERSGREFWKSPDEVLLIIKECRTKGEWMGELVARKKDGTLFDVHLSANLIKDPEGRPIGMMASCVDITERKRADKELKRRTEELSEAKKSLDLALEVTGMGTWDYDVVNNIISWDDNLFRLVGVSRNEFNQTYSCLIKLSNKIVPPEDIKQMRKALQDVMGEKTDWYELEHRIIRPDGSIRHFAVKGRAYRNSMGEPVRIIGTTLDITARKEAEEALRKSEAELSRAQAIAHLGNYSWDIHTDKISYSEELKSIWGFKAIDKPSFEIITSRIHPDDLDRVRETGRRLRENGHPFNTEYRIVRPDGSIKYVHDKGQSPATKVTGM